MNALLMDAPITSSVEECALGMGQSSNYAAVKDAQIGLSMEEFVGGTGQSAKYAAVKDAQVRLSMEECALGMGQRSNDAAVKDAQIKLKKEECALNMGQSGGVCVRHGAKVKEKLCSSEGCTNVVVKGGLCMGQRGKYAAEKDAQIKLKKEECARGMGLRSTHKINLLHLDQNLNRLLQLKPYPINVLREQPPEDKEEVLFQERMKKMELVLTDSVTGGAGD
eukprot:scaffold20190_cov72-Skeletonema_dohrnii-CCMP3373.AAC.1